MIELISNWVNQWHCQEVNMVKPLELFLVLWIFLCLEKCTVSHWVQLNFQAPHTVTAAVLMYCFRQLSSSTVFKQIKQNWQLCDWLRGVQVWGEICGTQTPSLNHWTQFMKLRSWSIILPANEKLISFIIRTPLDLPCLHMFLFPPVLGPFEELVVRKGFLLAVCSGMSVCLGVASSPESLLIHLGSLQDC